MDWIPLSPWHASKGRARAGVINVCNQEIKETVLNGYFYCPSYISKHFSITSRAAEEDGPFQAFHDNEMSPLLISWVLLIYGQSESSQGRTTRSTARGDDTHLADTVFFLCLGLVRSETTNFDIVKNDVHKTHKQHIKINFNKNLRAEKQNQTTRVTKWPQFVFFSPRRDRELVKLSVGPAPEEVSERKKKRRKNLYFLGRIALWLS